MNWKAMSQDEKIDWLHSALQSLQKSIDATQDDLSGLSRRVIELDQQQNSTYELAKEVVATVERIETVR